MNNWLHLLILALAVTRITRLVTTDVVFARFREFIWDRFGDPGSSRLGYLITCNWCTSMYSSSLVVLVYKMAPNFAVTACAILALSMVAGLISSRAD